MLTSFGLYGDEKEAIRAGIECYIGKPVRQSRLYHAIAAGAAGTSCHPCHLLS